MRLSEIRAKMDRIAEEHPGEDPQVCQQECEVVDVEYNDGIVDVVLGSRPDLDYYLENENA